MTAAVTTTPPASLALMLRSLKLPTVARHAEEVARLAEREGWTFERYVHHLVELEVHERRRRRIERHLKESDLPRDKTLATLDRARLPIKIAKQLATLWTVGSSSAATISWRLACQVVARPTSSAPSATS